MSFAAHALVVAWATTAWSLGADEVASSDDFSGRLSGYSVVRFVSVAVPAAAATGAVASRRASPPPVASDASATAARAEVDIAAIVDSVADVIARDVDASIEPAGTPGVQDFRPLGGGGLAEAIARSFYRGRRGNPFLPTADFPAVPLPDNPIPDYPDALLAAGVEGEVRVRFLVDTTGALDPHSVRVVASTDARFTRAVQAVLPRLRFLPAESGGTKVPAPAEQVFAFVVVLH